LNITAPTPPEFVINGTFDVNGSPDKVIVPLFKMILPEPIPPAYAVFAMSE
jgi:hypothetical protein